MRIIVFFVVGREKKRCRLVLDGKHTDRTVEVEDRDRLGDPRWVTAKNIAGVMGTESLLELALRHVLGAVEDPHGSVTRTVTKTDRGLEIELGAIQ